MNYKPAYNVYWPAERCLGGTIKKKIHVQLIVSRFRFPFFQNHFEKLSSKNQLYSGTVAVDPDNEMVTHQTENTIAWVHEVPHRGEYYFITW